MSTTARRPGANRFHESESRDAHLLARSVLEASPDSLRSLLRAMPADSAGERPVKDEWSGLEVMRHFHRLHAGMGPFRAVYPRPFEGEESPKP
jgi:hypothetical protein